MVIPRYGAAAKVAMTAMLLALSGFFVSMAVLVSHDSELRCGSDGQCRHLEHYPFGVETVSSLPQITGAEVRWDPGGRSMALKLVLRHPDGSKTEYQGVGTNGDRAEETARAIEAWRVHPSDQAFPLRSGSLPVAVFLAVMAIGGAFLAPHFFARIRVAREGNMLTVAIGEWPAPPRRIELPAASTRFGVRPITRGNERFFSVCAEQVGRDQPVELRIVSRREPAALARAEALNAWLATTEEAAPRRGA